MRRHLLIICLFGYLLCPAQENISLDFTSNQYEDLTFLKAIIGNKRIVCLGEEDHWFGEYFQLKNRVIKFLVEEMDFSVLIFEGSGKNSLIPTITTIPIQDRIPLTLNLYWQTHSVYNLIRFMEKKRVLQLGVDPISYEDPKGYYLSILKEVLYPYSPDLYGQLLVIDKELDEAQNKFQGNSLGKATISKEQSSSYQQTVNKIVSLLTQNKAAILKAHDWQESQFQLLLYSLRCTLDEITFLTQKGMASHMTFRDKSMAKNLLWLIEEFAPDKKIIVWAANLHLSKNTVVEKRFKKKGFVSMMELLPESSKDEVFTVALSPSSFLKKSFLPPAPVFFLDRTALSPKDQERGFDGAFYFTELTSFRNFLVKEK